MQNYSKPCHVENRRKPHKANEGFTIIELLIVIVVIAILAALSVVSFSGIQNRARVSSRQAEIAQWKKLSEAHKIQQGIECPHNFAFVYANSALGTTDFCVMKYEAKNVGGVPTSQPSGLPWNGTTQAQAAAAANSTCAGCRLISDIEWMAIAADVLTVKYNWSGGDVASGYIYSGHNDNAPANALAASVDDADGYSGTGNSETTGANQRRTLYLKSGDVVWDMAGNLSEWTSHAQAMSNAGITGESSWTWREWTTSGLSYGNIPSYARHNNFAGIVGLPALSSWNSTKGIGQFHSNYSDTAVRPFIRGGTYYDGAIAGILKLYLGSSPTGSPQPNGFRVTK